ncbi:hypothetical protein LguiB_009401 [Lonicera macranthoides]
MSICSVCLRGYVRIICSVCLRGCVRQRLGGPGRWSLPSGQKKQSLIAIRVHTYENPRSEDDIYDRNVHRFGHGVMAHLSGFRFFLGLSHVSQISKGFAQWGIFFESPVLGQLNGRSYKSGYVWHDLSEDDLILPAHGSEYVLKGSELFEDSNSGIAKAKEEANKVGKEGINALKDEFKSYVQEAVKVQFQDFQLAI